jgi:hypothetical protein
MLLLAMDSNDTSHTYGDASDDASDDVSTGSDISFAEDLCIALLALLFRATYLFSHLITYSIYFLPNCV